MKLSKHLALLPAFTLLLLVSLFHLFVAPYTKVEESFTLHAVWDILTYGLDIGKVTVLPSQSHLSMTIGNFLVLLNGVSYPRYCYRALHIH